MVILEIKITIFPTITTTKSKNDEFLLFEKIKDKLVCFSYYVVTFIYHNSVNLDNLKLLVFRANKL